MICHVVIISLSQTAGDVKKTFPTSHLYLGFEFLKNVHTSVSASVLINQSRHATGFVKLYVGTAVL